MAANASPTSAPAPGDPPRGRFRRALARAAAVAGLGSVFVAAVAVGAAVHLDSAASRRLARQVVTDVLHGSLQGEVELDSIAHLSLWSTDLPSVVVRHPDGQEVLHLDGVHARFDALAVVWGLLRGKGDLAITLPELRIEHADIVVDAGNGGALKLQEAISATPSPEPSTPGRPLRLELSRVLVEHAWAHGAIAPPQVLDARVEDLAASVVVGAQSDFVLDRARITEQRLLPVPIAVQISGHARLAEEAPMELAAKVEASVGAIAISAEGELADERVSARVTAPRVAPEAVLAIQPGLPLQQPLSIAITAQGKLTEVEITAHAMVLDGAGDPAAIAAGAAPPAVSTAPPGGEILARARLNALDPTRIVAELRTLALDPRVFAATAPEARVTAEAQAEITLGKGPPRVVAEARTEPFSMAGQRVPATEARATFEDGELRASAMIREPGAPIEATFARSSEGAIRFEAQSSIPSLGEVPRIPSGLGGLRGSASLHVAGSMKDDRLDATAKVRVAQLGMGRDLGLGYGEVSARAFGPLDALQVQGSFLGAQLRASGVTFERVTVGAAGPVSAPRVRALLSSAGHGIDAAAELHLDRSEARAVHVQIARGEDRVEARAARIGWGRGIAVDKLAMRGDGAGELDATFSFRRGELDGEIHADALDLGRLAKIAGVPLQVGGLAQLDVALHGAGKRRAGHVSIELEDGVIPGVAPLLSMNVTARLEGEALKADGLVRLIAPPPQPSEAAQATGTRPAAAQACRGAIASVRLDGGQAKLRGSLLDGRTWQGATGSARLTTEVQALHCVLEASPVALPLSELSGQLTARVQIERTAGHRFPSVRDLLIRTRGLRAVGPVDDETGAPAWASTSLDGRITGELEPTSGSGRVSFAVLDRRQRLVAELSTGFDADLETLVSRPEARTQALARMPVAGHLTVPRRKLDELGRLVALGGQSPVLSGSAELDAYFAGTLAAPRLVTRVRGSSAAPGALRAALGSMATRAVELDTLLVYDGHDASLDAYALRGRQQLLTANARVKANAADLLGRAPGVPLAWSGSVEARLDDLPLGEIPFLADRQIGGHVRGEVKVRGLFVTPEVTVRLDVPDLQLGPETSFETAHVSLDIPATGGARESLAKANVLLVAREGGRIEAKAQTRVAWQAGALPTLTGDRSAEVTLSAQRFRLNALETFLQDSVSRLDGYLDGHIELGLGAKEGFSGDLRLSKGVVQIPQLGQAFENASLRLVAGSSGDALRVENIRAEAQHGQLLGDAAVRMKGLEFQSARANFSIPAGRDLPVALEGVPLGEIRGKVSLSAENKADGIHLSVDVPALHVALPPTIGRSVQSLEEHKEITTSAPLTRKEYEVRRAVAHHEVLDGGSQGKPLVVVVRLGDIRIEGEQIQASLTGDPRRPVQLEIAEETRATGNVKILSGKVKVIGKEFIIDPSLVALNGTPSNPYLNVTAYNDTKEGSRIYIDYVGELSPITDDKIKFRSDPPRPQGELMSELLFGSQVDNGTLVTGSTSQQPNASGGMAAGVGAGIASAQINAILRNFGPFQNFETNFATTDEGALKTTVGYELGEQVTASASYQGAASGQQGTTGGTAQGGQAQTEVSLEWRFLRDWFFRGSVDNGESPGTSFDVLWKHRY